MLSHMVYFTLVDKSPAAQQRLVDLCKKHLDNHPGLVHFSVGTLSPKYERPVNDREYQVGLNLIFQDHASHDAYQVAPRHNEFIELAKPNWEKVRVFDTDLA